MVLKCSGVRIRVENGTGGKRDLLKGVGALKGVDISKNNGEESDDIMCSGGWRRA